MQNRTETYIILGFGFIYNKFEREKVYAFPGKYKL